MNTKTCGKKQMRVVLGIDPGYDRLGFGVIGVCGKDNLSVLDSGVITTQKSARFPDRLCQIQDDLFILLRTHKPDLLVTEEVFFTKNARTAMKVAEVRGAINLIAAQNKIQIFELTPLQVKAAITGYGSATKKEVQRMVALILKLKSIPRPDDVADALALAICGALGAKREF